jgi:broad specificity phosphatase PhoE
MKLNNQYYLLRHGEAVSNKKKIVSSWPEKFSNPLTQKGKQQIKRLVPKIKALNINLIFSSDLLRTKQTARIISEALKFKIKFDKRLREVKTGNFEGKPLEEWYDFYQHHYKNFFTKKPKNGGENYREVKKRARKFLIEINKKYKNKKILIVSHGGLLENMQALVKNQTEKQQVMHQDSLAFKNGEVRKLN